MQSKHALGKKSILQQVLSRKKVFGSLLKVFGSLLTNSPSEIVYCPIMYYVLILTYFTSIKKCILYSINMGSVNEIQMYYVRCCYYYHMTYQCQLCRFTATHKSSPVA